MRNKLNGRASGLQGKTIRHRSIGQLCCCNRNIMYMSVVIIDGPEQYADAPPVYLTAVTAFARRHRPRVVAPSVGTTLTSNNTVVEGIGVRRPSFDRLIHR